jgi:hypothetical protein
VRELMPKIGGGFIAGAFNRPSHYAANLDAWPTLMA